MDDDAARDARGKKYGWWASNLSDAEAEKEKALAEKEKGKAEKRVPVGS